MSEKHPQKASKNPRSLRRLAADSPKPRTCCILGYVACFQGHVVRPPVFVVSNPSELCTQAPSPLYQGPLGCGTLQARAQTNGCQQGSMGSTGERTSKQTTKTNQNTTTYKHIITICQTNKECSQVQKNNNATTPPPPKPSTVSFATTTTPKSKPHRTNTSYSQPSRKRTSQHGNGPQSKRQFAKGNGERGGCKHPLLHQEQTPPSDGPPQSRRPSEHAPLESFGFDADEINEWSPPPPRSWMRVFADVRPMLSTSWVHKMRPH